MKYAQPVVNGNAVSPRSVVVTLLLSTPAHQFSSAVEALSAMTITLPARRLGMYKQH